MLTTQPKKKRAANRKKHLQIKKTLSSIWQRTRCKCSQHNQKRNTLEITCIWLCCEHLQRVSLFVCVASICTICCQNDENVFLICWCFFYLHVFSEVAARWALSATLHYCCAVGKCQHQLMFYFFVNFATVLNKYLGLYLFSSKRDEK